MTKHSSPLPTAPTPRTRMQARQIVAQDPHPVKTRQPLLFPNSRHPEPSLLTGMVQVAKLSLVGSGSFIPNADRIPAVLSSTNARATRQLVCGSLWRMGGARMCRAPQMSINRISARLPDVFTIAKADVLPGIHCRAVSAVFSYLEMKVVARWSYGVPSIAHCPDQLPSPYLLICSDIYAI